MILEIAIVTRMIFNLNVPPNIKQEITRCVFRQPIQREKGILNKRFQTCKNKKIRKAIIAREDLRIRDHYKRIADEKKQYRKGLQAQRAVSSRKGYN